MVKQIMKKSFAENEVSTTQASHNQKTVKLDNQVMVFRKSESRVLFSISGTRLDRSRGVTGYERRRFRSLIPSYIRDSNVAAIVYDVSSGLFLPVTSQTERRTKTYLTGTTKWPISGMTVK